MSTSTLDQHAPQKLKVVFYNRPHRILVLLHARSKYPTPLANMSFDEILNLTADVFLFYKIAIEKPYTTARTLENG